MQKLHRQFSHASKESLWRLLKSGGVTDHTLEEALSQVLKDCNICLKYKPTPLRPCVSEPWSEEFNSTVAMDLKSVEKDRLWILHLICLGTRYAAAGLVRNN